VELPEESVNENRLLWLQCLNSENSSVGSTAFGLDLGLGDQVGE